MITTVQYDLNENNFLNKGQTNKHFLIQIAKCYHKLKNTIKKKDFIMITVTQVKVNFQKKREKFPFQLKLYIFLFLLYYSTNLHVFIF